jgi:hypothetical protein
VRGEFPALHYDDNAWSRYPMAFAIRYAVLPGSILQVNARVDAGVALLERGGQASLGMDAPYFLFRAYVELWVGRRRKFLVNA